MNSFLNQFKNSRGKYDAKKIFWELFGMLSLILVFIMILFIIWSLSTAFWGFIN